VAAQQRDELVKRFDAAVGSLKGAASLPPGLSEPLGLDPLASPDVALPRLRELSASLREVPQTEGDLDRFLKGVIALAHLEGRLPQHNEW